jgi:hypothetical protein
MIVIGGSGEIAAGLPAMARVVTGANVPGGGPD